jgi:mannose-6-phosphate isomerase
MQRDSIDLYPLLFEPVLKKYVWGGRSLETLYGRDLPDGIVAESWEIAAHRDGATLVENGRLAGRTLIELQAMYGLALIGRNSQWAQDRSRFPLLVKLLDAQQRLSVQVHPHDSYPPLQEKDELGKSEMWVVLHAQPGAQLILGVSNGTRPDEFRKAIDSDKLAPHLHHLNVATGDFVCVPSGSIHAILGGIVIAEIQQNSNETYRVYDWGRINEDRPLHIDQAMDVINFELIEPSIPTASILSSSEGVLVEGLCQNEYFSVERVKMATGSTFDGFLSGDTFEIWGILEGTSRILNDVADVKLDAIRFCLLPASIGKFSVEAEEESILLRTYVADHAMPAV